MKMKWRMRSKSIVTRKGRITEMRRVLMILMIKRIILIMGIMKMIGKTGTLF